SSYTAFVPPPRTYTWPPRETAAGSASACGRRATVLTFPRRGSIESTRFEPPPTKIRREPRAARAPCAVGAGRVAARVTVRRLGSTANTDRELPEVVRPPAT